METHTTEEQQIAAAKEWLKQNGTSIVTGIILGFAVLFGVRAWIAWQDGKAQLASDIYTVMISALDRGNSQEVTDKAGMLIAEHADSGYAAMAALAVAKVRIEEGQLEAARAQLQWVLDNSSTGYLHDIARLRLARVMLAQDDPDGAEQLLDSAVHGQSEAALYAELRGDIHLARGEQQQAAQAYRDALASMSEDFPGRQLVQMKLDNTDASSVAGNSP